MIPNKKESAAILWTALMAAGIAWAVYGFIEAQIRQAVREELRRENPANQKQSSER